MIKIKTKVLTLQEQHANKKPFYSKRGNKVSFPKCRYSYGKFCKECGIQIKKGEIYVRISGSGHRYWSVLICLKCWVKKNVT